MMNDPVAKAPNIAPTNRRSLLAHLLRNVFDRLANRHEVIEDSIYLEIIGGKVFLIHAFNQCFDSAYCPQNIMQVEARIPRHTAPQPAPGEQSPGAGLSPALNPPRPQSCPPDSSTHPSTGPRSCPPSRAVRRHVGAGMPGCCRLSIESA